MNTLTSVHIIDGVDDERYRTFRFGLRCVSDHYRHDKDRNIIGGCGAWNAACQVLHDMQSLRTLFIQLTFPAFGPYLWDGHGFTAREEIVFEPLRKIRNVESFHVQVDWPESESFKKGERPFTLTRIPRQPPLN